MPEKSLTYINNKIQLNVLHLKQFVEKDQLSIEFSNIICLESTKPSNTFSPIYNYALNDTANELVAI